MKHRAEFAVERPGSQVETQKIRNGQCSQCIPAAPKKEEKQAEILLPLSFSSLVSARLQDYFTKKVDMGAFD